MTDDVGKELRKDVPRDYITTRGKGRNQLDYVSGRYVKQRLNELFGFDGWSSEVVSERIVTLDDWSVRWFAHVRLTIHADPRPLKQPVHDGMAVGHGLLMKEKWVNNQPTGKWEPVAPGRANEVIDFAAAEAVTDALKRAAVNLGQNLGLSLYPMAKGQKSDPGTQVVPAVREVYAGDPPKAVADTADGTSLADALRDEVDDEPRESLMDGFARRLGSVNSQAELQNIGEQIGAAPLKDEQKAMLKELYRQALGRVS